MDPSQLQPGYRLDRYELLCPLAYGGMASVWLARFGGRLGFERMVVIKMILPQYSQDPRFQEMFLDEARIASRIEHSNVARILDVGDHDGSYFIVMEWVDGDSLSKIHRAAEQRGERVPLGVTMRIIADAASGLHAAHALTDRDGASLGVVHRDVSPQNILIANSGATMIIDFGVAKARDRISQETSAGQLKGKIRYMAPEQALGRAIDHRADVWALGAMLYEMFTGSPPYDGPNEVATLHKLTSGMRPAPVPTTLPPALRSVVERALAYEVEDRFADAMELNLALEAAMVEIDEVTSAAMVATYTGELLAERKAARKRAVENALEQARDRDQSVSNPMFAHTPSGGTSIIGVANVRAFGPPSLPRPLNSQEPISLPSDAAMLQEVPSNATLGSANMEYLSESAVHDIGPRRRRYLAAAALGVMVAAGVIGAMLIVTAMVKHEPPSGRSNAGMTSEPPAAPPPPAEAIPSASAATESTPTSSNVPTMSASSLPQSRPQGSHRPAQPPPPPTPPSVKPKPAPSSKWGF